MSSNPVAFDRDLATGFRAARGFVSAYPKFRCVDDRLSNGENGPITDGHRAGAKFRLPERSHSAPRRQSNTEGATESVGTSVLGSRVVP
jgi:hypothetical protein